MSIVSPDPDSKTRSAPPSSDATHGVCACQVDATPRLAICGVDCSGEEERWTDTFCVVCLGLFQDWLRHGRRCERCRG